MRLWKTQISTLRQEKNETLKKDVTLQWEPPTTQPPMIRLITIGEELLLYSAFAKLTALNRKKEFRSLVDHKRYPDFIKKSTNTDKHLEPGVLCAHIHTIIVRLNKVARTSWVKRGIARLGSRRRRSSQWWEASWRVVIGFGVQQNPTTTAGHEISSGSTTFDKWE